MRPVLFVVLLTIMALAGMSPTPAAADIDVGSDGSDGTLIVTSNTAIDLSQAVTAAWNTAAPIPGKGVYDSQRWAVVFKYDSVFVAGGVTLTFSNHPSTAPVVWLVSRGVHIEGRISLDGGNGANDGSLAAPGPGGFRGGKGATATTGLGGPGFGPGGGGGGLAGGGGGYRSNGAGGQFSLGGGGLGGTTYGGPQALPLIGGSGGGGAWPFTTGEATSYGGGAGGGAILIAAGRTVALLSTSGAVSADGGSELAGYGGGGSGGTIRIIADSLAGAATLYATGGEGGIEGASEKGGRGGAGCIRLETNKMGFTGGSLPGYTLHYPVGPIGVVWPPEGSPSVSIVSVAGQPVPADPTGRLLGGDVQIPSATSVPVTIAALNVPTNATVRVRAVPVSGTPNVVTVNATYVSGSGIESTWTATLPSIANNAYTMLQARVTVP